MTVRGGGVRKNHGFHAVVQNGSAASELSLPMRKTASWSGVIAATTNTRLRHECSCATSELPSTRPSRPQRASCRARVCQGMAWHRREHEEISERRPTGGCRGRYGDFAAGWGLLRLDCKGRRDRLAAKRGRIRRCERTIWAWRDGIGGGSAGESEVVMRAWSLPAESRQEERVSGRGGGAGGGGGGRG